MMTITILLAIQEVVTNVIKRVMVLHSYGECVLNDMIENAYKVNVAVDLLSKDSEWEELLK
jgi:thymidine phosphorylase